MENEEKHENTPTKVKFEATMKVMASSRKECNKFSVNSLCQSHSSQTTDSPFKFLTNISTPPSRFFKVKNPFDAALVSRLHCSIASPSVFQVKSTPIKCDEKFHWTIDDMASLNPAPIEEYPTNQFELSDDPDIELAAQENIDKYFRDTEFIVPSPLNPITVSKINPTVSTPRSKENKPKRDGIAQTVMTFPSQLPKEVEDYLRKYFTYTEEQQQSPETNLDSSASLVRRLFHHPMVSPPGTESENVDIGFLSPANSPIMGHTSPSLQNKHSPFEHIIEDSPRLSPVVSDLSSTSKFSNDGRKSSIHQSTPTLIPPEPPKLSVEDNENKQHNDNEAEIPETMETSVNIQSEIDSNAYSQSSEGFAENMSRRSTKRLNFSGNMSGDNLVPDIKNLPNDQSMKLMMVSLGTSLLEHEGDCTYSSVDWEIENKSILQSKRPKNINLEDISYDNILQPCFNMNTSDCPLPKRQRLYNVSKTFSEENKENIPYVPTMLNKVKSTFRRSFSDIPFGSKISNSRCRSDIDISEIENYYMYRKPSNVSDMESDRDHSFLGSFSTSSIAPGSPVHFHEDDTFVCSQNTHDTGYNSNVGDLNSIASTSTGFTRHNKNSLTNIFTITRIDEEMCQEKLSTFVTNETNEHHENNVNFFASTPSK